MTFATIRLVAGLIATVRGLRTTTSTMVKKNKRRLDGMITGQGCMIHG